MQFRSSWALVFAIGWYVVVGLAVVDVLWRGTAWRDPGALPAQTLTVLTVAAFLTVVVWAVAHRPVLQVGERGVLVRNVLRDAVVPWPRLQSLDSRWSLALVTDAGTVGVWAVPARESAGVRRRRQLAQARAARFGVAVRGPADRGDDGANEPTGGARGGPGRPATSVPEQQAVVSVLTQRLEQYRREQPYTPDPLPDAPVEVRWAWWPIGLMAVSGAAAVIVALLG